MHKHEIWVGNFVAVQLLLLLLSYGIVCHVKQSILLFRSIKSLMSVLLCWTTAADVVQLIREKRCCKLCVTISFDWYELTLCSLSFNNAVRG
jgi:hypothetical protein